jgi:hypothetical protein
MGILIEKRKRKEIEKEKIKNQMKRELLYH